MTLGIVHNRYSTNVSSALAEAAARLGLRIRNIDLSSLRVQLDQSGGLAVADDAGAVEVTALSPYLLFGVPAAVHALRVLTGRAFTQNPVDGVLLADDKAATAITLAGAGIPQVPTWIGPLKEEHALQAADAIGYPLVLKRTHGAQGRWVRRAAEPSGLASALRELETEGPGALVLQPEVTEFLGRSIRAVVSGGDLLVATLRTASADEWRSNVAGGADQRAVDLTPAEQNLAVRSARALGLGHAGIDLLRTSRGPVILEVNACPDFTSMIPHTDLDLSRTVLLRSMSPAAAN
jgi:ribosomal protein S6--L-glutamate ligase